MSSLLTFLIGIPAELTPAKYIAQFIGMVSFFYHKHKCNIFFCVFIVSRNQIGGYMKRITAFLALSACLLLLLFAQPAMRAAQTGLTLWWGTLLPTLFPFFVCASLIERTGALHMLANALYPLSSRLNISHYALPVLLLSGMSGYPSGARLCGMLQQEKCVNNAEAEQLGIVSNLCSPMFLIGAVAGGMFGDMRYFIPFAAGHYGGAVLVAILLHIRKPMQPAPPCSIHKYNGEPFYMALPKTIASGMGDMLKVGGTVVFFLVLAELFTQIELFRLLGRPLDIVFHGMGDVPASQGILLGLLEMTGGCHLIMQAGLPIRTAATLCSFLISFGGISVFVQAMAFVQFQKPVRYILTKLVHGGIAAAITYFTISRSAGAMEVFAPSSSPYIVNAISSVAVLLACALGLVCALLLAILFGRKQRRY